MPENKSPQYQLPDAELDVMTSLWAGDAPMTARQIREAVSGRRPMAHASVCTLLGRLEEKGLVARRKGPVGKAFVYRALVQPASTHRRLLDDLRNRVFGGSGVALVASLFEGLPVSDNEISELEQLLSDLRKRNAKATK